VLEQFLLLMPLPRFPVSPPICFSWFPDEEGPLTYVHCGAGCPCQPPVPSARGPAAVVLRECSHVTSCDTTALHRFCGTHSTTASLVWSDTSQGTVAPYLHRITEWLRWEETCGGHLVQQHCSSWVTYSRVPRTMSRQYLNISKEGDSTVSLGDL